MVRITTLIGCLAATASVATAHPGEKHDHMQFKRQLQARDDFAFNARRSLEQCEGSEAHKKLMKKNVKRRANILSQLREKRGITSHPPMKYRRDLATLQEFEDVNHNMTGSVCYTKDTSPSVIFSANTSCLLTPEVTSGPYYVTGELIRSDVKENLFSDGVDLYLDVQYIDISTCGGVENVYVDIWNANATGVYSGISTSGNYAADGYNSTYLRGIQVTDEDGVVAFESIFPGHYDGRATHTHLLAHMNSTVYPNNTITGGRVSHIGQLFYPEDLRSDVEAIYPYTSNTQDITSNDDDMWSIVQAADEYDPFPEFVYLGEDVSDGLLAWIQIGINTTVDYSDDDYYSVAAYIEADGGHANSDSFIGGGGGGDMGGNGTMTGEMPTGTAPPTS
ncbi:aromatic compound dioxygenase [Zalerion maritima]|uniref:Aromatic compound dioxygenase n=1 Tax=Zalerion maritima TaxID=339359 RepID=A0AAD5WNA5_9PEZI|nr:aromatic compound dioxygenase [Zalerion maritima]